MSRVKRRGEGNCRGPILKTKKQGKTAAVLPCFFYPVQYFVCDLERESRDLLRDLMESHRLLFLGYFPHHVAVFRQFFFVG